MNKRITLILASMLIVIFSSVACRISTITGSGNMISEDREVSGFDRIAVGDGMWLYLTQGDQESLRIEAEDNILPLITSRVSGDQLVVRVDQANRGRIFSSTGPINVYVTMIDVNRVEISGGGRLETESLVSDGFNLEVSGGGRVNIGSLQTDRFQVNLSGGSHAEISGQVDEMDLTVSGGGGIEAEDMQCRTALIDMSGGGNGTIWVTERLDATLSGGSRMSYYGNPQVSDSISGGGSLRPLGDR